MIENPAPEKRLADRTDPEALYQQAHDDRLGFWADQARALHWDTPFTRVLDASAAPFHRWFDDGRLNASYNCLDRHVEAGLGDRVAFHWCGETGERSALTHAELLDQGQRFANA